MPNLLVDLQALTQLELDAQQGFVISRVNGQWSLQAIAQICPFDQLDVLALFAELEAEGLIRVEAPTPVAR